MKIVINIKTDNAAFEYDEGKQFRILRNTVLRIVNGEREGNLKDTNGNNVGNFKVTGK